MHDVKLVWVTPDVEKVVGYCARVSNPKNQNNPDVAGLLRYCIKNKHWSIFQMGCMCVEVTTTRAISAQMTRHSSFSFQEHSQRYAQVMNLDLPELRRQDKTNRQNSISDLPEKDVEFYYKQINKHFNDSMELYVQLLEVGVARECARGVLPMNSVTTVMMMGHIRSWLHYIDLRKANGTQKEHQQIALNCLDILKEQCPTICEAMWPSKSTEATPKP
tara:strand:- start:12995 stop:13648 length:654 start_codon:yes stop_codon:yes gene_type:complete